MMKKLIFKNTLKMTREAISQEAPAVNQKLGCASKMTMGGMVGKYTEHRGGKSLIRF